jgi:hypothetical protein
MSNRLQRWGERALGQVQSVSPRISSRFEPEMATNPLQEAAGFQEIEVEIPVRRQPLRVVPPEPDATIVPPSPQLTIIEEKRPPVSGVQEATPAPDVTAEPPSPPPEVFRPPSARTVIARPTPVPEESERPQRSEPRPLESVPPAPPQPPPPSPTLPETSLVALKRFQEWIATPPREKPSSPEPLAPPAPKEKESVPTTRQTEARGPAPPQLPTLPRVEPPRAIPPPIVVSIGTIIVRANPSMVPKPVAPDPADSLAAFLARRTAGQP